MVNCSRRVVRKNALTYLVNVTVVCLIMAEDFSDISDGEVVCATQLVEELNRYRVNKALKRSRATQNTLSTNLNNKMLVKRMIFFACTKGRRGSFALAELVAQVHCSTKLLGTINIILLQAGPKFDGI